MRIPLYRRQDRGTEVSTTLPTVVQLEIQNQDLNPGPLAPVSVCLATLLDCMNPTGCTRWKAKLFLRLFQASCPAPGVAWVAQDSAFVTSIPRDPDKGHSGHTWRHVASLSPDPTSGPGWLALRPYHTYPNIIALIQVFKGPGQVPCNLLSPP